MTNINKTIEAFEQKYFAENGELSVETYLDIKEFIEEALKTQEQSHQKKLEELKIECVGKTYWRDDAELAESLDEPITDKYKAGYNEKRQEIKETFRTINKT